jgi:7-cyano-7-deazaguanine synthase
VKRAVVLLSGGLDSATALAIARAEGFAPFTLAIDYGQRHRVELTRAEKVAVAGGSQRHIVVAVDLRSIGGSALTAAVDVPKDRPLDHMGEGIPITYVPARNTVFLSLALGYAEVLGAFDLFIGANALDYSGYPDCRGEYLEQFERLGNLATKAGVEGQSRFRVHAPLLQMTKAQIVRKGVELGVDYGLTLSCYDPDSAGRACGHCDSCQLRRRGFEEANVPDPTVYQ